MCNIFQLPLSGSHLLGTWVYSRKVDFTFNSLSRDHRLYRVQGRDQADGLSTPSLGITRDHSTMVLGFSSTTGSLSTPSLGITSLQKVNIGIKVCKSFNSLSRDHGITPPATRIASCRPAFNSLSRDHRARFRDFPALRGFLPRHLFAQMIPKATIWIYRFAPL